MASGTFTAKKCGGLPASPTRYRPDRAVSENRATPASSPAATGTSAVSPSGPWTTAFSPTAVTGKNSSSASPARTVCRSGLVAANRNSSCAIGRKLGSTGQSVQSWLNELVYTITRPRCRGISTTAGSRFSGNSPGLSTGGLAGTNDRMRRPRPSSGASIRTYWRNGTSASPARALSDRKAASGSWVYALSSA